MALGPACIECGKPVLVAKGARHLTCSPVCPICWAPVDTNSAHPDLPGQHAACTKKRATT